MNNNDKQHFALKIYLFEVKLTFGINSVAIWKNHLPMSEENNISPQVKLHSYGPKASRPILGNTDTFAIIVAVTIIVLYFIGSIYIGRCVTSCCYY